MIELAGKGASREDVLGRSAMNYAFSNPKLTVGSLELLNQAGAKIRGSIISLGSGRFQAHHIEFGAHHAFHEKLRYLLSVTAPGSLDLRMLDQKEIRLVFGLAEKELFLRLIHASNERRKKRRDDDSGTVQIV